MKFSWIFLLIVLFSCSKRPSYETQVIGHAGNGLGNHQVFGYDNSLKSIEIALGTDGCDGVELDIQLSKDKTLWLYHDEFLESATGSDGSIFDKTDAQLSEVSYDSQGKHKLIRLNDVPKEWLKSKSLFIDIKDYYDLPYNEFVYWIDTLLTNFSQENPECFIKISNRNLDFLSLLDIQGVERISGLSELEMKNLNNLDLTEIDGVMINYISEEEVQKVHQLDKSMTVFGLKTSKSMRQAMEVGVDYIITDDIATGVIEKN